VTTPLGAPGRRRRASSRGLAPRRRVAAATDWPAPPLAMAPPLPPAAPALTPLYGGALAALIPGRLADVASARPVPDHQEAFSDPAADEALVFEIVARACRRVGGWKGPWGRPPTPPPTPRLSRSARTRSPTSTRPPFSSPTSRPTTRRPGRGWTGRRRCPRRPCPACPPAPPPS
jgi:hypothetical protein